MKHSANSQKTGFTLIEIMLALMVITIGIVSITGLLSSSISTSSKAHDDITVVSFADLVLNTCHANGYSSFNSADNLEIIELDGSSVSLNIGSIASYTGTVPAHGHNATQEYNVSYRITIEELTDSKSLSLEIWPDRNTTASPRRFNTEIYNWNKDQ